MSYKVEYMSCKFNTFTSLLSKRNKIPVCLVIRKLKKAQLYKICQSSPLTYILGNLIDILGISIKFKISIK